MAGAQELQEIETALRSGGAKPSEVVVADLGAAAIHAFVASTGVVHRDPGCARQAGAQHIAGLGQEAVLALVQQPHHLALGDRNPQRAQLLD